MKKAVTILSLLFVSSIGFAGELDGKTFCRTVERGGMFGQPKGKAEHCVSFKDDVMTDNANTFFGNPPESLNYVLVAGKILKVRDGKLLSTYSVDESGDQISNGAGAILKVK